MRKYAPMEDWQRLWTLVAVPARDMRALHNVLEMATADGEVSADSVDGLPVSVRWVAEDYLPAVQEVVNNLADPADLIVAWDATHDHDRESSAQHRRLNPKARSADPIEPPVKRQSVLLRKR
jgi:hypothetical protein